MERVGGNRQKERTLERKGKKRGRMKIKIN